MSESGRFGANDEGSRLPPELEERDGLLVYRGVAPFDTLSIPEADPNSDYEWAWHDPEIQRKYVGLVVAVANRRVFGVGKNEDEAWAEAHKHPDCPPEGHLYFVPVYGLSDDPH